MASSPRGGGEEAAHLSEKATGPAAGRAVGAGMGVVSGLAREHQALGRMATNQRMSWKDTLPGPCLWMKGAGREIRGVEWGE